MRVVGRKSGWVCAGAFVVAAAAWAEGHGWSYAGEAGPEAWGRLDPAFATCKLGEVQSPIDIRGAKTAALPPIRFDYHAGRPSIVDNGHTVQVDVAPGSAIEVGADRYDLIQFHFHKPSEERIEGAAHDMVAHLVHRDAGGRLAVVAVLLDRGSASPLIEALWRSLPPRESPPVALDFEIDLATLLPAERGYFTYPGSLTTPPCSENVRWFVLKQAASLGEAQLAAFGARYAMNARPVQPLHAREILATP